ncbi:hypothetical protein C8R47DRAFT_1201509 [Mycena vitilis]|nr:hypothetical protein C8R47DRAFT_1201509 [Mycena vitilis]
MGGGPTLNPFSFFSCFQLCLTQRARGGLTLTRVLGAMYSERQRKGEVRFPSAIPALANMLRRRSIPPVTEDKALRPDKKKTARMSGHSDDSDDEREQERRRGLRMGERREGGTGGIAGTGWVACPQLVQTNRSFRGPPSPSPSFCRPIAPFSLPSSRSVQEKAHDRSGASPSGGKASQSRTAPCTVVFRVLYNADPYLNPHHCLLQGLIQHTLGPASPWEYSANTPLWTTAVALHAYRYEGCVHRCKGPGRGGGSTPPDGFRFKASSPTLPAKKITDRPAFQRCTHFGARSIASVERPRGQECSNVRTFEGFLLHLRGLSNAQIPIPLVLPGLCSRRRDITTSTVQHVVWDWSGLNNLGTLARSDAAVPRCALGIDSDMVWAPIVSAVGGQCISLFVFAHSPGIGFAEDFVGRRGLERPFYASGVTRVHARPGPSLVHERTNPFFHTGFLNTELSISMYRLPKSNSSSILRLKHTACLCLRY